jgi:hypothetical protein
LIELSWPDFKAQVIDVGTWQWIYFEVSNHYHIYGMQNNFQVLCKIYKDSGADQTEFEADYKDNATSALTSEVVTQEEKNDKVLKLAGAIADFSGGEAMISLLVPGTPGGSDGRWAAGGYAFADAWTIGDRITKVQVVDTDNLLGYGAGTVLKEYYDSECAEPNRGWYMYPAHSGTGEIEIDPIGGYGFIPAGMYIEIYAECASSTKLVVDIWWAKTE